MQIKLAGASGWIGLGLITQPSLLQAQEAKPINDAKQGSNLALEWHFAGFEQVNQVRDLSNYRQIINLPESRALVDSTIGKLAKFSAERFGKEAPAADKEKINALIKPLIRSAYDSETRIEVAAGADGKATWVFGIKTAQRELWSTNLWQLASISHQKPDAGKVNEASGWTSSAPGKNYQLALWTHAEWLYISGGPEISKSQNPFANSRLGGAQNTLLRANFDFPQLGKMFHDEKLAKSPKVSVTADPRGNSLRSEVNLTYGHDLGIKLEPWQIPTNTIQDPVIHGMPGLIGFTAIQGVRRILEKNDALKELGVTQSPNQLFFWAESTSPFSLSFAAQLGNPAQFLKNFIQMSIPDLNEKIKKQALGSISTATNESRVSWKGLPIIVPFLATGTGSDQKFLVGGLFPLSGPLTNPAPAELFQQVTSQKDLVYYDWEITEARMAQWRPITQLYHILRQHGLKSAEAPGDLWLNKVQPYLGNTITEAVLAGPNQLKITRRSDVGLSSLELVLWMDWLDNPAFPGWNQASAAGNPSPKNSGDQKPPGKAAPAQKSETPNPTPL